MNCSTCGKPINEGDAFCRNCGAPLPKDQTVGATNFVENEIPEAVANSIPKREETWQEKYLTADGRLNRKPYILRGLLLNVVGFIVAFLIGLLGGPTGTDGVSIAVQLIFGIPGVMLAIRRLHDLGRSGWWWLLVFVPIVNLFLGIYLIFFKGQTGTNRFGPDPLQ